MKIWKLSPLDLNFAGWRYSEHKGDAIVRAEDEKEARDLAVRHFSSMAEKVSPCQETPRSPWDNSSVVECIELDNSEYPTDGLAKVLKPESFDE